jgi:hypothetical protein
MAEEILYCPSCNNKLRMPTEMLGEVVQCPLCNLVFTTPSRGRPVGGHGGLAGPGEYAQDEASREQARLSLRTPAIGLLVTGVLGVIIHIWQISVAILNPDRVREWLIQEDALLRALGFPVLAPDPDVRITGVIVTGMIFLGINSLLLLSAFKMLGLRTYGLALTGSIFALLDCGNGCCLLAWPFGIWALVVLMRLEVRAAFD